MQCAHYEGSSSSGRCVHAHDLILTVNNPLDLKDD